MAIDPELIVMDRLDERTEEDKNAYRVQGLGGSDVAAALGLSPYSTPWEVFHRKRGEIPPVEDNPAMEWGRRLEPAIAQKYADDTGVTLIDPQCTVRHRDHEWALASPDRLIEGGGLLEVKTAGHYVADRWEDEAVPDEYMVQVQWYCEVIDEPWADFAVLIGGQDYRVIRFDRDQALGTKLIELAGDFWADTCEGRTPEVNHSDRVADLYPQSRFDVEAPLSATAQMELRRAAVISGQIKELEKAKALAYNVARMEMADADIGVDPESGDHLATWRTSEKTGRRTFRNKAVA